jgi:hypothetical protein
MSYSDVAVRLKQEQLRVLKKIKPYVGWLLAVLLDLLLVWALLAFLFLILA